MGITSFIGIIVLTIFVLAVGLLITGIRNKNTIRIMWAIILFMVIIAIYFLFSYLLSLM